MVTRPIHTSKTSVKENSFLIALDNIIQPEIKNYRNAVEIIGFKKRKGAVAKGGMISVRKQSKNICQTRITNILTHSPKKVFSYTQIDAVKSVRAGIDYKNFKSFYDLLNLTNKKWAEILGISEKTMQNLIKEKKFLEQKKSEKLVSFLLLVKYGIEVFGSQNSFEEWLVYKTEILMNKAPIDYLDTIQGINLLHEQIFKIETGNLV